jgi:hypothetical protein
MYKIKLFSGDGEDGITAVNFFQKVIFQINLYILLLSGFECL